MVRGSTLPTSRKLKWNSKIISYVEVGPILFRLNSIRRRSACNAVAVTWAPAAG
jgi:hypothetical protein